LPCSKHPNQLRFFSESKIFCPVCENKFPLSDKDTKEYYNNLKLLINSLNDQIVKIIQQLENPFQVFLFYLSIRENSTLDILSEPETGDYLAWVSLSYLIDHCFSAISDFVLEKDIADRFSEEVESLNMLFYDRILLELIDRTKNVFKSLNELLLLERKWAFLFQENGIISLVKNERTGLDYTPGNVIKKIESIYEKIIDKKMKQAFDAVNMAKMDWNKWMDHLDTETHDLLYSNHIYRKLRISYPNWKFPGFASSDITKIEALLKTLFLTFTNSGMKTICFLLNEKQLTNDDLKLIKLFELNSSLNLPVFKPKLIYKVGKHRYLCPGYSMRMLQLSLFRLVFEKEKSRQGNIAGLKYEWHIREAMSIFDLQFSHPITGKILIGYRPDIYGKKELADLMCYNSRFLFVIESKYRYFRLLKDLELEFAKFPEKIDFIKTNIEELGFDKHLQVIPLIVTPNVPYAFYENIPIVRHAQDAVAFVGNYVDKFYQVKPLSIDEEPSLKDFSLVEGFNATIAKRVDAKDNKEQGFYSGSVDLSENLYRIHDAEIHDIGTDDIDVIALPTSRTLMNIPHSLEKFRNIITFDVTSEIRGRMIEENVSKGDLVRFLVKNISGGWTQIQAVDYLLLEKTNNTRVLNPLERIHSAGLKVFKDFTLGLIAPSQVLATQYPSLARTILSLGDCIAEDKPCFLFIPRTQYPDEIIVGIPFWKAGTPYNCRVIPACRKTIEKSFILAISDICQALWYSMDVGLIPNPRIDVKGFEKIVTEITGLNVFKL